MLINPNNNAKFIGYLANDPSYDEQMSGKERAWFRIGVKKSSKNETETTWVSVTVWRFDVRLAKRLKKGDLVEVNGVIGLRTYNKDGKFFAEHTLSAAGMQVLNAAIYRKDAEDGNEMEDDENTDTQ